MQKKKTAMVYAYDSALDELRPMLESREVDHEDILSFFASHPLLVEKSEHGMKDEAEVLAEAKRPETEEIKTEKEGKVGSRTYSLTYYNPETHKAEIIEEKTDIRMNDPSTRVIEESVGMNSSFPVYAFIATPLIRREVVPWMLEQILNEREYGTPPEFGGAAVVKEAKAEKKSEVAALKQEEAAREALLEALERKEDAEKKLSGEIVVFEEVVQAVRAGEDPKRQFKKLPPLSRARYVVATRKKKLPREAIINLLMQDLSFLKTLQKKLEMLSDEDLLAIVKAVARMRKKGKV